MYVCLQRLVPTRTEETWWAIDITISTGTGVRYAMGSCLQGRQQDPPGPSWRYAHVLHWEDMCSTIYREGYASLA